MQYGYCLTWLICSAATVLSGVSAIATEHVAVGYTAGITWHTDYAKAMSEAEQKNRMLFIYFCDACAGKTCSRFKA